MKTQTKLKQIIQSDSFNLMKELYNNNTIIDFILTDVPYNNVGYKSTSPIGGSRDKWEKEKKLNLINDKAILKQSDKNKIFEDGNREQVSEKWDYIDDNLIFTEYWLSLADKILKEDGTIAICCGDYVIGDIQFILNKLNYKILNTIVWFKTNAPPNITCRTLTHSTEFIIWASKSGKNWTFNYKDMKAYTCEEDFLKKANKQMRNVWFTDDINQLPQSNMWIIPNNKHKEETKFGKHPTQKPVRLFERLIKMATNEGDLVFDPFAGSCTTAVVAEKLNRQYVCCDKELEYIEIGKKRVGELVG